MDAEGIEHPQVLPLHLNLCIPTALSHQYVGHCCSGSEQLHRVFGIPSSKHLEVREDCLTPVCQEFDSETLFLIRSVCGQPGGPASESQFHRHTIMDRVAGVLDVGLEGVGDHVKEVVIDGPFQGLQSNQVSFTLDSVSLSNS